jgi:hypothetical protein
MPEPTGPREAAIVSVNFSWVTRAARVTLAVRHHDVLEHEPMKRILVVGTSGSGKTTVAQEIASRLNLNHHASDDFYWQPGWQPAAIDRVDDLLDQVLAEPSWVLDGNFEHRWEDVWNQADQIVWLDYSFLRIIRQVASRNVYWLISQRPVWSGNRMTLFRAVSGIRHSMTSFWRKRSIYPRYIAQLQHTEVVRFYSRHQTKAWLADLIPELPNHRLQLTGDARE